MAKQLKKEGLPGLLQVKTSASSTESDCQQDTDSSQAPASPITQPAFSGNLSSQHSHTSPSAGFASCRSSEHLHGSADSSDRAVNHFARLWLNSRHEAAEARVVVHTDQTGTPSSDKQLGSNSCAPDVMGRPLQEQTGQRKYHTPWIAQMSKTKKGMPRPSSWQRRRAAKLRREQETQPGCAHFSKCSSALA